MNNQDIINTIPKDNKSPSDIVSQMNIASDMANNPEVVKEIEKYGNISVVYGPTRSMLRQPQPPGLLTFIQNAMTEKEVNNLLNKGKLDYKRASFKTIKKWEIVAKKRITELTK